MDTSTAGTTGNRMHRVLTRCLAVCYFLMLSLFLGTPTAYAWTLFTPLLPNQILSPAQTDRVNQIKQRPTTASLSLMRVDLAVLSGDHILVLLNDGWTVEFSRSNVERRGPDDFTWFGAAPSVGGQAILVVKGGNITGSIGIGSTRHTVEPVGDGVHALVKVDQSRAPGDAPPVPTAVPSTFDIRETKQAKETVEIDVLVAYTTAAREAAGSEDNMVATIQAAIDTTNQTYENSKVHIKLRLVDSFEIKGYSERGKPEDRILDDFYNMQAVRGARYVSGADVAVLMIHGYYLYPGIARGTNSAEDAYAVVVDYFADTNLVFAHELGHIIGACEESALPGGDGCNAIRPYAQPFVYDGWRTIMSTNVLTAMIPYWSNPQVEYGGIPTGTADKNNARVLNEKAEWVAAFRDPRYEPCASEGGICAFNGQKEVAYGANLKFVYRTASNRIACTYKVFGDPLVGVHKACYVGPRSYTFCSIENQFCSFSGTRNVAYGAHNKFFYKTMTNGIDCNNGTFGDPIIGVAKSCYIGPEVYSHCAGENQFCAFDGTKNVAYGANGQFVYKTATNGIACNNVIFGDPIVGVGKACYIGPDQYTFCTSEWTSLGTPGSCDFSGTKNVAYGANGHFVYKMATNHIECSNSAFGAGNLAYGTVKACYIGPEAYSYCASEWMSAGKPGFCAFRGTKTVAYGANGRFFYRTETNGVECSNERFGDPISGVVKSCYTR